MPFIVTICINTHTWLVCRTHLRTCFTDLWIKWILSSIRHNHVAFVQRRIKSAAVRVCKRLYVWNKMRVTLHKLTESTCGCCETLLATVHRGFHAAQRGDRVSMVGSPHRPALSQPAERRAPCVRPGLGEKGYIIGPWPLPLPCSSQLFHHKKMSGMEAFFFYFSPKFPFLITRLSSWLRQPGNSPPSHVQKHVCAISHSIKIYLPSKHGDKLIQSWDIDLNSRLAVPFQIPGLICDTGRIYISAL